MAWAGLAKSRVPPSAGASSSRKKKITKNNFPVAVKIRTSGYQTLECFNATLDPNLGLNPSLTDLQILACELHRSAVG